MRLCPISVLASRVTPSRRYCEASAPDGYLADSDEGCDKGNRTKTKKPSQVLRRMRIYRELMIVSGVVLADLLILFIV